MFHSLERGEQTLPRLCLEAVQCCRTSWQDFEQLSLWGICRTTNCPGDVIFVLSFYSHCPVGGEGWERSWAAPGQPLKWKYHNHRLLNEKHHFHQGVPVHWQVWGFWFCSSEQWDSPGLLMSEVFLGHCSASPVCESTSRCGEGGWAQISAGAESDHCTWRNSD